MFFNANVHICTKIQMCDKSWCSIIVQDCKALSFKVTVCVNKSLDFQRPSLSIKKINVHLLYFKRWSLTSEQIEMWGLVSIVPQNELPDLARSGIEKSQHQ